MPIAAHKFQFSMMLAVFAGGKLISFSLPMAVVLPVWHFANDYYIFIFAQLISPSV